MVNFDILTVTSTLSVVAVQFNVYCLSIIPYTLFTLRVSTYIYFGGIQIYSGFRHEMLP